MGVKQLIIGGVVTLVIGGTTYTVSQTEVIDNFATDTGLTHQEAEEYVKGVDEGDLESWDKIGATVKDEGSSTLSISNGIDCANYTYEWVSPNLSCDLGKSQLTELGQNLVSLGNSYTRLAVDNAASQDISETIRLIGLVNSNFDYQVVQNGLDSSVVSEIKKTNSYNKATLQAALDSK